MTDVERRDILIGTVGIATVAAACNPGTAGRAARHRHDGPRHLVPGRRRKGRHLQLPAVAEADHCPLRGNDRGASCRQLCEHLQDSGSDTVTP